MSTSAEHKGAWMFEMMQEVAEEFSKRPAWEVELLRNAPRMYPGLRAVEGVELAPAQTTVKEPQK